MPPPLVSSKPTTPSQQQLSTPEPPTPSLPILSRSLFLRLLGLCHVAIGLSSLKFGRVLYGTYGLQPLEKSRIDLSSFVPYFWIFFGSNNNGNDDSSISFLSTDRIIELSSFLSILLGLILLSDSAICHACIPLTLYLIQTSYVNAPTPFLSNYGWEWQLSKASLLATFLCPLLEKPTKSSLSFLPQGKVYTVVYPWLIRLAAFRIMWGAGMSKLGTNASDCWSYEGNFSCTTTHYETMPLPNIMAYFFHKLPFRFHQFEVLFNHFVELVCPYGLIFFCSKKYEGKVRTFAALASIGYMMAIIATGTYSIINWVTIVFLVSSLDEEFLRWILPLWMQNTTKEETGEKKNNTTQQQQLAPTSPTLLEKIGKVSSAILRCSFALLVLIKTRHPILESLSPSPWLKQFDEYHIAPAYGVFGFVNQIRLSPVIETKRSVPSEGQGKWEEIELKCLPGKVDSTPCIPYFPGFHYRLDWDVWIKVTASLEHPYSDRSRFVPNSVGIALSRLLLEEDGPAGKKDADARNLFRNPPSKTPTHVKISLRQYQYTDITTLLRTGHWWKRSVVSSPGRNNNVIIDRDAARRIASQTGKMSLEQQQSQETRFPPPEKEMPHPLRDTILILTAVHIVFGLIASSKMIAASGILSFLLQSRNVMDVSIVGVLLVLGSLVGYKRIEGGNSTTGDSCGDKVNIKPASRRE